MDNARDNNLRIKDGFRCDSPGTSLGNFAQPKDNPLEPFITFTKGYASLCAKAAKE